MSDKTLVIGDSHGNVKQLQALLEQEGCVKNGKRLANGVSVVHIGDLGHFGAASKGEDREIYERGVEWLDVLLWGNHDRSVCYEGEQYFGGYVRPDSETIDIMEAMHDDDVLRLAHYCHGFVLTHAGIHPWFKHAHVPEFLKKDPEKFVQWINDSDIEGKAIPALDVAKELINTVGPARGGRSVWGGILWRDASENLYPEFRQVFGHSSARRTRQYQMKSGNSYCIDTSKHGRTDAIWLPEERIVSVGNDA